MLAHKAGRGCLYCNNATAAQGAAQRRRPGQRRASKPTAVAYNAMLRLTTSDAQRDGLRPGACRTCASILVSTSAWARCRRAMAPRRSLCTPAAWAARASWQRAWLSSLVTAHRNAEFVLIVACSRAARAARSVSPGKKAVHTLAAYGVGLHELRRGASVRLQRSHAEYLTLTFGTPSPAMCAPDDASWNMMLYVPIRTWNSALSGSLR
jgi:hypothetical protein